MLYKLHMNGVITGSLNSFCLACDIFLKSQQEATDHIGTPEHRKKSDAVQYSDKFQDEHIKKFKGGYYCEFCNVLMPIASKVNFHINEDEHKHNKGILLLKPLGGDVVAFNNIVIEEKAWHGLIDGVCSLCNTEFEDETEHKTDASHSLNLVLKPIQFGADSAIFRHLDDTAVQCLTCNKLLAPGRMTKHFDDTEHHELYAKSRFDINDKTTQSSIDKQNTEVAHDIIKPLEDNVGSTASKAASHEEDNDTDSSSSHDDFHIPPKENFEKCSQEEDARDFAEAIKITYNGDNNQFFCHICQVHVPASLRSMREHVEGANHKRLVVVSQNTTSTSSITQPKTPGKQEKRSTNEFVDSAYDVRGLWYTASIINEKFFILQNSFYLILENSSRKRCIICEVNLPPHSDIEAHALTRQHCIKLLEAPVIVSEKKEFIREVRSGLYHCGYCNLIVAGWADMKLHLECSDHWENRTIGENRMRLYYSDLQRAKIQLDRAALARLFNRFR